MALSLKNIKYKILSIFPILLLLFVSFNGNSIIDFNFFSINLHFIIVYYWALRDPDNFGYGFIFLSGIINDVVYGLPFGVNALCLLLIAAVAAYVRVVAVRVTLVNDWISFVPALLFANFIYFLSLYFSSFEINYLSLFKDSLFTLIFYPIMWALFSFIINLRKS